MSEKSIIGTTYNATFEEIINTKGFIAYTNVGYSMMPLLRQKKDIIEIKKNNSDRYKKYDFGASFTTDFKHFDDFSDHISIPPLHKHGTIFKAPAKIVKNLIKVSNSSSR